MKKDKILLLKRTTKQLQAVRELGKTADNITNETFEKLYTGTITREYCDSKIEYGKKLLRKKLRLTKSIQNDLISDFRSVFGENVTSIDSLIELSRLFLRAYWSESSTDISEAFIDNIAYLAVATYLESWLDSDISCQQTLHRFSEFPYIKNVRYLQRADKAKEKNVLKNRYRAESRSIALHRAFNDFKAFYQIKQDQAVRESTYLAGFPEKTGTGVLLNYTTLAWCEAHSAGALKLLVAVHKEIELMSMSDASKKATCDNCNQYYSYLQSTDQIQVSNETPQEQLCRFVASSMMFHRLERVYQFSFKALYVKMVINGEIKLQEIDSNIFFALFARYIDDCTLFHPTWSDERLPANKQEEQSYGYISENMQIMGYSDMIKLCHHQTPIPYLLQLSILNAVEKYRVFHRTTFQDLHLFLHTIYPPQDQPSWETEQFHDAAVFYKEKYPVVKELLKYDFPEMGHSDYDTFYRMYRQMFDKLDSDAESEFRNARDLFSNSQNSGK